MRCSDMRYARDMSYGRDMFQASLKRDMRLWRENFSRQRGQGEATLCVAVKFAFGE